jgi:chromosome segregation ATPase
MYRPATSNGRPETQATPAGIEAAIGALVSTAVAREAAPLRDELEAALAVVRRVGARLAATDQERRELERQRAALEAEQARLADAIERHRTARAAYEDRRREMSRLMVETTRTPPVGSGATRGR